MRVDVKVIDVKESVWRKKADELRAFGWILVRAIKYIEKTTETTYEGRVVDDRIYIEPHTTTNQRTWVELKFKRYPEMYSNLLAIYPLEILYGILCILLGIAKWIVTAYSVIMVLGMLAGGSGDSAFGVIVAVFITIVLCWLVLILLKKAVLRIARAVLKEKHFSDTTYDCDELDEYDLRN